LQIEGVEKNEMRTVRVCAFAAAALCMPAGIWAQGTSGGGPGCEGKSAKQCVELALEAMGGRERLQQLKSVRLQSISHTLLVEQSYRQAPFITSYERDSITLDLTNQRLRTEAKVSWPEADAKQSDFDTILIVGPEGGVNHSKDGDSPCGLSDLDAARQVLALGPERLLLNASDAADLHFEVPRMLRSTSHAAVSFKWQKVSVRVLLNPFNHLPDAVETTRTFQDFWYFWGDVQQRIYFDNWKLVQGVSYPTNQIEERNGMIWSSLQAVNVEFNGAVEDKAFAMDPKASAQSLASPGWNHAFHAGKNAVLAPGIDLFLGSWNSTVVKQPDGIVILEAPISGLYTQGVIEEAKKLYPGTAVKAVLSTSDSWPHTGGVRAVVAQGLPVYILDLNEPLLDKMMTAPHTLDPDALAGSQEPPKPDWRIVSGKEMIGNGQNRMELYPLRGASTERQYMVYFPGSRLLYASDTLAMNGDGTLYDPELMHEVVQAVQSANLQVDTVFAMHQGPMPWAQVVALVEKAQGS
jgi:hypothetical protein